MRRFESYLPSDLRVFARGILRMKLAIFGLPPFPFLAGFGLTAKIAVAVFSVAVAVGGAIYAFSQKIYAPETIQFDGRDFYLSSERNGDTGKVVAIFDGLPGAGQYAMYAAVYADSLAAQARDNPDFFYHQILYAPFYSAELTDEHGAFSAVAVKKREWSDFNADDYLSFALREDGDSIVRLWAFETADGGIRLHGTRCGASRKNAFICVYYSEYAKEWADAEGAAALENVYGALAEYPLTHNEELLADMAAAVK